jgi:hypothetical protein
MTRALLVAATFVSLILFPWTFSAILALAASFSIPFLPLAAGIFADTLYYTPKTEMLPLFTLYGAFATALALLVRARLNASIIRK